MEPSHVNDLTNHVDRTVMRVGSQGASPGFVYWRGWVVCGEGAVIVASADRLGIEPSLSSSRKPGGFIGKS